MHQLKEVDMLSTKMDLLWTGSMREPTRRRKLCTSMIPAWLVKSVETLGIQEANAKNYKRMWTTSTTTTTTTILNIIKARINSKGLTTQVTTQVIIKVIILLINPLWES
jgi:hydroxylamine reductase (hybrid-cluster protein)